MRGLSFAFFVLIGCGGSTADDQTTTTDSSSTDTAIVDTAAETRPTGSIRCGMGSCNAASEECCVGFSGAKCVMIGGCGGGTAFSCSDATVCKIGEVCCATSLTSGSKCATSCTGYVLCASDAECTDGKKCVNGLGGTKYCGMMMMSDAAPPG